MELGDKVQFIDSQGLENHNEVIIPVRNITYTVRAIVRSNSEDGIRLEEIINDPFYYNQGWIEPAYRISRFIKL